MKTDTASSRSTRISAGLHGILTFVLFAIILLIVNYLGFKHYYHRDLSQSQFYTLSPKTVDILKKLDSTLTIYTFLDQRNPGQLEQITTLLKEYQRAGGSKVSLEKIDPAYDITRAAELQKKLHFDGNDHIVIFSYKDKNQFVKQADLFDVNPMTGRVAGFKGEQEFTSALMSLIEGKASKVYFTEGHGEHSIEDTRTGPGYGFLQQSLKNENLETANLNLASAGDVPADASAVVIAGPSISFSPMEVQALQKYLDNNGKLMILLDPYVTLGMDDLLKKYGLQFDNDLALYRGMTSTGGQVTVPIALIYQGGFSTQPITAKFAQANIQMQITGARSITLLKDDKGQPNPKAQFLLQTDTNAFGWVNKAGIAPTMTEMQTMAFNKDTDIPGALTIAAAYDGGMVVDPVSKAAVPGTRLVVVGASKFAENDIGDPVGVNFFTNALDWLVKKNAVLDISPKKPQEYGISLSPMSFNVVWWCALIIVPGAALALGIFTWFSRRK